MMVDMKAEKENVWKNIENFELWDGREKLTKPISAKMLLLFYRQPVVAVCHELSLSFQPVNQCKIVSSISVYPSKLKILKIWISQRRFPVRTQRHFNVHVTVQTLCML